MAPPVRTITVALDMSKAFDTINIHTLITKLRHTPFANPNKNYATFINISTDIKQRGLHKKG